MTTDRWRSDELTVRQLWRMHQATTVSDPKFAETMAYLRSLIEDGAAPTGRGQTPLFPPMGSPKQAISRLGSGADTRI